MRTYKEIKKEHSDTYSEIMDECGVFWAFSTEQLKAGIKKIGITKENKMVSIGAGGYMPSKNLNKFFKLTKQADTKQKKELKTLRREEKKKAILYELNNHECFYSCSIEPVVNLFKGIYAAKAILRVYNDNKAYG